MGWDGNVVGRRLGLMTGSGQGMLGFEFLKEGPQCRACQGAEDDVGEVQHGQVGAGEEDDV